jgi:hypothetical protein
MKKQRAATNMSLSLLLLLLALQAPGWCEECWQLSRSGGAGALTDSSSAADPLNSHEAHTGSAGAVCHWSQVASRNECVHCNCMG